MKLEHFLHEVSNDNRHRVLAIDDQGDAHAGDWVGTHEIAVLDIPGKSEYYFANANTDSPLPVGVFTVKSQNWKSV